MHIPFNCSTRFVLVLKKSQPIQLWQILTQQYYVLYFLSSVPFSALDSGVLLLRCWIIQGCGVSKPSTSKIIFVEFLWQKCQTILFHDTVVVSKIFTAVLLACLQSDNIP